MTSTESPIIKLFKLNDEYDKQLDGIPFNEIMTTLENRITEIDEKYKLKVPWKYNGEIIFSIYRNDHTDTYINIKIIKINGVYRFIEKSMSGCYCCQCQRFTKNEIDDINMDDLYNNIKDIYNFSNIFLNIMCMDDNNNVDNLNVVNFIEYYNFLLKYSLLSNDFLAKVYIKYMKTHKPITISVNFSSQSQ